LAAADPHVNTANFQSGAYLTGLTCANGDTALGKEKAMTIFTRSDDLQGAEFVEANLRGGRFRRADLPGVVMRAVDVREADIDAPWLFNGGRFLRVNGVDVIPLVGAGFWLVLARVPGWVEWSGLEHVATAQPALGHRPVGGGDLVQRHDRVHSGRQFAGRGAG
jgi:hypothetical protein